MKNTNRRIAIFLFIVIVLAVWFSLNLFTERPSVNRASREIGSLYDQLRPLQGKEMTRRQVAEVMPSLDLTISCNQYYPSVVFNNPSNWVVRLVPEKKRAFSTPHSWVYRIMFLDFRMSEYPVISVGNDL